MEYSLGEILASIPALIVVHPGSAAPPPAADADTLNEVVAVAPPMAVEETLLAAQEAEPAQQDSDTIDYFGEMPTAAADEGHEISFAPDAEHAAPDALFAAAIAEEASSGEPGVEALEEAAFPTVGEDHEQPAETNGDGWGGNWGGFGVEAAHAHGDEATGLAEPEEADKGDLGHVDFAAITGKPAPGTAPAGEAAVAIEPPKKKKRKREPNLVVRFIGITVSGLLAVACVFLFLIWRGTPIEIFGFQFNTNKAAPKHSTPANKTVANADTPPANGNPTSLDGSNSAITPSAAGTGAGPVASGTGTAPDATAPNGATPDANPKGATKPESPTGTSAVPPVEPKKGTVGGGQPAKKPSAPDKEEGIEPGNAFGTGPDTKSQPSLPEPGKNDLGAPAIVAPVQVKPKTETPSAVKPESPTKPQTPATPATPSKPDETDPFAAAPEKPAAEKPKSEPRAEPPAAAKPESPAKPQTPATAPKPNQPDESDPFAAQPEKPVVENPTPKKPAVEKPRTEPKAEPPAKSDEGDPFSAPTPTTPEKEKPKSEPKPEVPAKPEIPSKPETTGPIAKPPAVVPEKKSTDEPKPEPPTPVKPDVTTPEVPTPIKPDVATPEKPEAVKPEPVKPEPNVEVKPSTRPLSAPSYAPAELDKALGHIATGPLKADVYRDWCQLAEVATFTANVTPAEKRAAQDAVKKLAANPQAVAELAAAAKKLLDDKATKGGIVLAGKVSGVAAKNGLFGTAIRMEGMTGPVMIFSAHPLDVKESQTVIVLGALVSDPAKNIPGYPGKQPVVVWADFALAIP